MNKYIMNELTLEHMMNPTLYEKYKANPKIQQSTKKERDKDIEKYKKKILSTTKMLFDNKSKSDSLNRAFDQYISECIQTFKLKERSRQPLPEKPPSHNDISFNTIMKEQNKTIKMDKYIKIANKKPMILPRTETK